MIHVLGLGVSHSPLFSKDVHSLLDSADIVIGSPRQLSTIQDFITHNRTEELPKLNALLELINQYQTVVILASGDPLYFGIGKWLSNNVAEESSLIFYPAVSSLQASCHQLGLSMQDCEVISLHGRVLNTLRRQLSANKNLIVLTDKNSHPKALAKECLDANLDQSIITVCEQLGFENQKVRSFNVKELLNLEIDFDPLHVSVIQTKNQISKWPTFPGFADNLFITDIEKQKNGEAQTGKGMITKREVRLNILSLLSVQNEDIIWDIGAGCGSVSIELAYWNKSAKIKAIEHNNDRLECLAANKEKFGVKNLSIFNASAPEIFENLETPNKVFIGGSDGRLPEILTQVWEKLPKNGVLVASCVTENTKATLLEFMRNIKNTYSKQAIQVAINKSQNLGGQLMFKPNLPVTIIQMIKQ